MVWMLFAGQSERIAAANRLDNTRGTIDDGILVGTTAGDKATVLAAFPKRD